MTPRVLITGATGFIGLPCVHRLIGTGAEVHALARNFCDELPGSVQCHTACLLESNSAEDVLREVRPTHLMHLAWIATPGIYWASPDNRRWLEASTRLLLAFSHHGGQRAILAGTCAEYDWTKTGICHEQTTPVKPATLYGQCKNEFREQAETIARERGLSMAWARLFFLYGPRERPARLVPSVIRSLLAGEPAECTTGFQRRDFLHLDDVTDALLSLLRSPITGPVNIGSGDAVSVREVVEAIAEEIGRPDLLRIGAKPTPPNEPPLLVADTGRLRDEVGWRPRFNLRGGLRDAVAWWRARHAA